LTRDRLSWARSGWLMIGLAVCVALAAVLIQVLPGNGAAGSRPATLRILATDDLADVTGLLDEFTEQTGITVLVDRVPLDELLRRGAGTGFTKVYDAVWAPESAARPLPEAVTDRLEQGTVLMSSPLVLGLRADVAGTVAGSELSWRALADAGAAQPFSFGMVDPTAGDHGAAALLGIATDLAGAPEALTSAELYRISPQLRALRGRQVLTGSDYRDLTERFAGSAGGDAVLTLESEILRSNAARGAQPGSQLVVVAPAGQAVFLDYRLRPVVPPWRRSDSADLQRLTDFLTAPAAQRWIARNTYRRPADPDRAVSDGFADVRSVAAPRSPGLLARLPSIYLDEYHYPTRSIFVLDVSGSMRGAGMRRLRSAFHSLDATVATRHGVDAELLLIPFTTKPGKNQEFTVTATDPAAGLGRAAEAVDRLEAGGGTAIYAALEQADEQIADRAAQGREMVTSIFLITDGENTNGPGLAHFRRHRAALELTRCTARSRERCRVPVYPVLVGDADLRQMRALAAGTGGQVHDARTVNLGQVLQELTAGR
jgi:Ca-activated chloride channel family protein